MRGPSDLCTYFHTPSFLELTLFQTRETMKLSASTVHWMAIHKKVRYLILICNQNLDKSFMLSLLESKKNPPLRSYLKAKKHFGRELCVCVLLISQFVSVVFSSQASLAKSKIILTFAASKRSQLKLYFGSKGASIRKLLISLEKIGPHKGAQFSTGCPINV